MRIPIRQILLTFQPYFVPNLRTNNYDNLGLVWRLSWFQFVVIKLCGNKKGGSNKCAFALGF